MNGEKLEALWMDCALGAAPAAEDVQELIGAYLEKDEGAKKALASWQEVADLARAAVEAKKAGKVPLPAFPRREILAANRNRWWGMAVGVTGAVVVAAACVVLGIVIGVWGLRPAAGSANSGVVASGDRPQEPAINLAMVKSPAAGTAAPVKGAGGSDVSGGGPEVSAVRDIWAIRLPKASAVERPSGTLKVKWESPLGQPQIGGGL